MSSSFIHHKYINDLISAYKFEINELKIKENLEDFFH